MASSLYLGAQVPIGSTGPSKPLRMPAHHLVTHAAILGMTGSGKSGLVIVLAEEALRAKVPVLMIDVKGDLPNLLLAFPSFAPSALLPWVERSASPDDEHSPAELAASLAAERRESLEAWSIHEPDLAAFRDSTRLRVITPGATAGELLHVLSSLERPSDRWQRDPEAARDGLSAAVSLLLRLLGRDSDPAKSREHVVLSLLAERRLRAGQSADLGALLDDLAHPPLDRIGALELNDFFPKSDRRELSAALNTLLASPTFASWREGTTLDVRDWMTPRDGRTPGVIVSVAHLDDEERALVLGVLLEEVLGWVRSLPGSQRLRALVVFDEVYGFLPPHPQNPPTKRPLVSLMKQARAFGVGVVVATQNPMDLDYRALSNAGVWCIGRLQTDADRARVIEGLAGAATSRDRDRDHGATDLNHVVQRLAERWFVLRDVHSSEPTVLFQPRWAMSFLRGPMTRSEIRLALGTDSPSPGAPSPAAPTEAAPARAVAPPAAAAVQPASAARPVAAPSSAE